MVNWKSGMVSAGGTELHVTRGGEGPPVVILHRDIGTLDRLAFYDELAQSHEVIVPNHQLAPAHRHDLTGSASGCATSQSFTVVCWTSLD